MTVELALASPHSRPISPPFAPAWDLSRTHHARARSQQLLPPRLPLPPSPKRNDRHKQGPRSQANDGRYLCIRKKCNVVSLTLWYYLCNGQRMALRAPLKAYRGRRRQPISLHPFTTRSSVLLPPSLLPLSVLPRANASVRPSVRPSVRQINQPQIYAFGFENREAVKRYATDRRQGIYFLGMGGWTGEYPVLTSSGPYGNLMLFIIFYS